MAFSFTPGQVAAPGTPNQGFTPAPAPGAAPQPQSNIPSVPDSPFLFMRNRDQPMSVNAYLQIILIFVAVLSVAFSLLLFLYSQYLTSSIESKKADLLAADSTFKEYPLDDMKRLSRRFATISKLLKDYVSTRSPLRLLEDVVEKPVVFNDFTFSKNTLKSGYIMSFSVTTNDYRTLIQQLESLDLAQYSKIVPKKTVSSPVETPSTVKVQVTTQVFAQGTLADQIVFVPIATSTPITAPSASSTAP